VPLLLLLQVGTLAIERKSSDEGELRRMSVLGTLRRAGIASRLGRVRLCVMSRHWPARVMDQGVLQASLCIVCAAEVCIFCAAETLSVLQ
jgi:hypothetical protein